VADVAIVTACAGDYDNLRTQIAQSIDVDWLFVGDREIDDLPAPWRQLPSLLPTDVHPRRAAKHPKLTPWRWLAHRHVVWIDASMEVTSPTFAEEALAARSPDGIAAWRHPHRACIYDEAKASHRLAAEKYRGEPTAAQVADYRRRGHPKKWGLFACGTLAWDTTNPRAMKLGEAWLDEVELWSYQDQLSLPFVARSLGVKVGVFPHCQVVGPGDGAALINPWMRLYPHRSNR
jgi:hypothetical protein